jgi:hypothetical protein
MSPRKFKQARVRELIRLRASRLSSGGGQRSLRRIHARLNDPCDFVSEADEVELDQFLVDLGLSGEQGCEHPSIVLDVVHEDGSSSGRCEACGEDAFPFSDVAHEALVIAHGGAGPFDLPRRTKGRAWQRRLQRQRWMQEARRYKNERRRYGKAHKTSRISS